VSEATEAQLAHYLQVPLAPPLPGVLAQIDSGPIAQAQALSLSDVGRLLDPRALECETGWSVLDDGVGYVAVRTEMPGVSAEMIDWWFDWHPRAAIRYRIWHPLAHFDNRFEPSPTRRAKAHWGTVHHPVEDVGIGTIRARIEFRSPREMGLSSDALDDPAVATIVCGYAGDDSRRVRHTPMFHVFLRTPDGVALRSRFWMGAAIAPYGPLSTLGAALLNRAPLRRRMLPSGAPRALARHCAQEYSRLGSLLPELYERFGETA
jgi:phloretin hydrolase